MLAKTPPFSSLPLQKDGPQGNAWGLFGPNDKLGTLNRLTPETTLEAVKEIVDGVRISTDLPLGGLGSIHPCFQRQKFQHKIHHMLPRSVNDDILTFNTQSSTQWDGLRHYGYQNEKVYFNGIKQENFDQSANYGIDVWANSGGITGRAVLLDWAGWLESQGETRDLLTTTLITASELDAVGSFQNTTFKKGDILLIRSGFFKTLRSLPPDSVKEYMSLSPSPPVMGLEAGEPTLRWLWEKEFSAVAGDMLTLEAQPFPADGRYILHEWLIAGWGMPIGELFDLERLAEECKRRKKWSFFFSSMPLKVPGGIASPPNGVAIL
ncbi:hypothetical protein B0H63DRAFT_440074 [Podospora didyma]|uniref:Cyclase n=1 Tax=Podospora didyma TaxID=330526 RepID=A0AAE0K542_9PEZI|nr:hypothetical protein B0H63DRAFT_440074 [Podospora didyma]